MESQPYEAISPPNTTSAATAQDELPPPYVPTMRSGVPTITCKVCQYTIDISGKRGQHVAKCNNCNEATPIKSAPPGKKYVRCKCNCLLICRASSTRIACPRPDCRRIIVLTAIPTVSSSPGMCRATCAICHDTFLFNTLKNALARCPHCRKVSSVGDYAKQRGIIFLVLGIVTLIISIGVTVGTYAFAARHGGVYVVFVGCFVSAVLFLIRAIYYLTMKVSFIDGPA